MKLDLTGRVDGDAVLVSVAVQPVNVGHRLPTGWPDRHLLLVVRAVDDRGSELARSGGAVLPPVAGTGPRESGNYAGLPGKLYGKLLAGPDGTVPAPFWQAVAVQSDTRLLPDQRDQGHFSFRLDPASRTVHVDVRLVYRKFFKPVADEKGWPDRDIVLREQAIQLRP